MQESIKGTLIFRGGCKLQNMGSQDEKRKPDADMADVAVTLLSRDFKGLGNYGSNGVIEVWKLDLET